MEDKKLKRPSTILSQRDKELERLKSLAVVSVLNKSFQQDPSMATTANTAPYATSLTPPSSLRLSNRRDQHQNYDLRQLSRSQSLSVNTGKDLLYPLTATSSQSSITSATANSQITTATATSKKECDFETENSEYTVDINASLSPFSAGKELPLEKRVQEMESLFDATSKKLSDLQHHSQKQTDLIIKQDMLIKVLTEQVESSSTMMTGAHNDLKDDKLAAPVSKQHEHTAEFVAIRQELNDLKATKLEYESTIANLLVEIAAKDVKITELATLAKEIQKENAAQTLYIDNKVQSLLEKVLTKDEVIYESQLKQRQLQIQLQQLQQQLQQQQQHSDSLMKKPSIKSMNNSVYREMLGQDPYHHQQTGPNTRTTNSARSSYTTTTSIDQRSVNTFRLNGTILPPASPPPSIPLPPVPTSSDTSSSAIPVQPQKLLVTQHAIHPTATIRGASPTEQQSSNSNKVLVVDQTSSIDTKQSDFEAELAEVTYYREFTEQLQARLSISKEIDELSVWKPDDYDLIQKKIESSNWFDKEDNNSNYEKDQQQHPQHAFWKGMKKKLRV